MLKYLIILLDDTAVSYCHYENTKTEKRLISLETLQDGIVFAMKHNFAIQFVYPDYELPDKYKTVIETIDHVKIMPASLQNEKTDVVVFSPDNFTGGNIEKNREKILVLRISKNNLVNVEKVLSENLEKITCLNIILNDIETFTETDFEDYNLFLEKLSIEVEKQYLNGKKMQINVLLYRILLDEMNNCNAGVKNITLAPNGKFYICPAFYYENEEDDIGCLTDRISIKNVQLYKLEYAPLCRKCDAYQCKRCVWLNRKTTHEINTPSHEQCVTAHLERNASLVLLQKLQSFFPDKEIKEIDYLDPFEVKEIF